MLSRSTGPSVRDVKRAHRKDTVSELGLVSQALERFTAKQTLQTQTAHELVEPVDELVFAIDTLNRRHQLLVERREFIFRTHAFATNDGVYLRRTVKSEEDFKRAIEALARLLYDGSDAVVAPELRGKVKPKLPGVCYRDSRSLLQHLVALRNYYLHIPTDDEALAKEHLRSAGDTFEHYCGVRTPGVPEFERGRIQLLKAAVTMIIRLTEKLPLGDHLSADDLFN